MTTGSFYHHAYSPLSRRLEETGLGLISSINVVAMHPDVYNSHFSQMTMSPSYEVQYTMVIKDTNIGTDEFEEKLLRNPEFEEMKRIIESYPELKSLYEKYKTIDRLSGNS